MSDPYESHVPVLRKLGHGIKRVLEFGSGVHSTPLFLDKKFYPHLTSLLSLEHNSQWALKVRGKIGYDERLDMRVVPEPLEDSVKDYSQFDMIFIDNSDAWENRVKTIEHVSKQDIRNAIVVIHDMEHDFYQKAAESFPHRVIDSKLTPWTGIFWREYADFNCDGDFQSSDSTQ